MSKIITQETFDDVVQENIVEFSMEPSEAKEETIKQFEAQGINLANIIKDLTLDEETGQPLLKESIKRLQNQASNEPNLTDASIISDLTVIASECDKSVPHRVLAAKLGAVELLPSICEKAFNANNVQVLRSSLAAFNALLHKQPDIFDAETLALAIRLLNSDKGDDLLCDVFRLLSNACIMHETNRQNIINADIVKYVGPLTQHNNSEVVKEVCKLFRSLILDDDIRVEFSKAHDHARIIASEVLVDLTKLLPRYKDNKIILCDLILTIASLVVRNEYCTVVEERGGLKFLLEAMAIHSDSVKINKEIFKLLRALAGNDDVKIKIIEQGAAPLIENALNEHKSNEVLAKFALLCISTLALRCTDNSKALFDAGISETIIETMKLHTKSKGVQRNGSWAIRNMVSRSRDQCDSFLSYGAEEVLRDAFEMHPTINQDVKAALRDLGCDVELKEEWTGTATKKISN